MTWELAPARSGVVVLAAYEPPRDLFIAQLRSIRDQTWSDFTCLVGADGGANAVRHLVTEAVGSDARFRVVGWEDRQGFYLNFARLLQQVPEEASWVALSDQDDVWYSDKLERLVPRLDEAILVTGQARVVQHPNGQVLLSRTGRTTSPPVALLFENQVTGALSVFRRELLDLALPFPRLNTVTQLHDHWLAMCAVSLDKLLVVDEVVQDYVQHEGNVIGEVLGEIANWTPARILERVRELSETYESGHRPIDILRACHALSFGWRRLMVLTLEQRLTSMPPDMQRLARALDPFASRQNVVLLIADAWRSGAVRLTTLATFIPGLPLELLRSRRHFRIVRLKGTPGDQFR